MVEVVDPQEGLHLAAILDLLLAHSAGHLSWVAVHTSHQCMSIGLVLGAVVMVLHKHHCHWRQSKCASLCGCRQQCLDKKDSGIIPIQHYSSDNSKVWTSKGVRQQFRFKVWTSNGVRQQFRLKLKVCCNCTQMSSDPTTPFRFSCLLFNVCVDYMTSLDA